MRKFVVATIIGSNRRESINRQLALSLSRDNAVPMQRTCKY
jgi:NAD(P)H-dependent FMN reductase